MTLVDQAIRAFEGKFGEPPKMAAQAPGRVNLMGDHIDYNDGLVLPMAIDRYTVIVGSSKTDGDFQFYLPDRDDFFSSSDLRLEDNHPDWAKYILGVLKQLELGGSSMPPLQAAIVSNVPIGAGLSSSAALAVATATLAEQLAGLALTPMEKARLCQRAEHESVGVPCGIMDQASAVLCQRDSILELDCQNKEFRHLPFSPDGLGILITNSMIQHSLADGTYAARRDECQRCASQLGIQSWRDLDPVKFEQISGNLPENLARRGQHIVTEISRARQASRAIEAGQWTRLGKLMVESHESLRDQFQVSCPELDLLVDFTSALPGVLGSRMTGAGFGGCTVSLIKLSERPYIEQAITTKFHAATGIKPDMFVSPPAEGAKAMNV